MRKAAIQEILDACAVEVDVLEFVEQLRMFDRIERGEANIACGRVFTQAEAVKHLEKWLR